VGAVRPVGEGLEPLGGQGGARYVVIAKDQPEYVPLPALVHPDGRVVTEWEPTEEERAALVRGERVRLTTWTFGLPLQPVLLEITEE
jgi:hypothetical protein